MINIVEKYFWTGLELNNTEVMDIYGLFSWVLKSKTYAGNNNFNDFNTSFPFHLFIC